MRRWLPLLLFVLTPAPLLASDPESVWLSRHLGTEIAPWMWVAAALIWTAAVSLAGLLIERGFARWFPANRASWLGRGFRLLCYLLCAVFALTLLVHGIGAAGLARPLLLVEQKLLPLAVAVGVADLALLSFNVAIHRYMTRLDSQGQPIARSPRLVTVLPLLRNIVMIILAALLGLLLLGQFGINLGPLLAGAGVVGVAVGLGGQKLLQDVITGASMVFENTLAVGDLVKIGDHSGTVEGISLRTVRLRDTSGAVRTVPFSAVGTVINMSREVGYHVFAFNLPFDADFDRAEQLIVELVEAMRADPELGAHILAPVEIWGLEKFGDWSVVLSGRIKTPAGRQTKIGDRFTRRLLRDFAANGVTLAMPTQRVQWPPSEPPPSRLPE